MITSEITKVSGTKHSVSVSVATSDIEEATVEFFDSIQRDVTLKGFRKGKAPINAIRAVYKYNEDVKKRINMGIIGKSYGQVVNDNKMEPLTDPDFKEVNPDSGIVGLYDSDGALTFTFDIDLAPEIDVVGYLDMELEEAEDTFEEDMKNRLETFEKMFADRKEAEDRPLQMGDDAVINMTVFIDGEETDKSEKENINIGSQVFQIPEFDERLVGMNIGEERELEVTFPDPYHDPKFSGKEGKFVIQLKEIHEVTLAEINDELAVGMGYKDRAGFIEATEKEMRKVADDKKMMIYELAIVEKLLENNSCDVPEVWLEQRSQELAEAAGKSLENEEEKAEIEEQASKSLQRGLIVRAIFKKENLSIDQNDIKRCIMYDAQARGTTPDELLKFIMANNLMGQYGQMAEFKNTYKFILDKSNLGAKSEPIDDSEVEILNGESKEILEEKQEETVVEQIP